MTSKHLFHMLDPKSRQNCAFFLQGNHYWHFDILKTTYWHGSFWIVHFHCRQFEYSTRMLMWFGENQIFRSQVWFTCVYLILHLKLKKFILLLLPYSWVLNTRRRPLLGDGFFLTLINMEGVAFLKMPSEGFLDDNMNLLSKQQCNFL